MVSTLIDHRNDVNMFKIQVEWQVVLLQIFEHFDVDKKYRPWKIVAKFGFCHNVDRFDTHLVEVSQETWMQDIISMDCTLTKHKCQSISTPEIAQLW